MNAGFAWMRGDVGGLPLLCLAVEDGEMERLYYEDVAGCFESPILTNGRPIGPEDGGAVRSLARSAGRNSIFQ